jgi:PAS domain S-box-containing protein
MDYEDKTKEQLINELFELRQQINMLKVSKELHEKFKLALATSERRFRELAELLPETVFELDLNTKLTFVNHAGFDIFGYSQEDFDTGINAYQVIAHEDHERLKENISRLYKGEVIGISEYTAQKKDGSRFPVIIRTAIEGL